MSVSIIIFLALTGMMINLSFSSVLTQPDWALALLIAALLSHRQHWYWVLPLLLLHDWTLHWSPFAFAIVIAAVPLLILWIDHRLGPAVPQRLIGMFIGTLPMLWMDWGFIAWVLTNLMALCCWYLMAQVHLESA